MNAQKKWPNTRTHDKYTNDLMMIVAYVRQVKRKSILKIETRDKNSDCRTEVFSMKSQKE